MKAEQTIEYLPSAQDLKVLIRQEHHRAELQRLTQGMDGCGCELCQKLYITLDLKKYGSRVIRYGEFVSITAGLNGAEALPDKPKRVTKPLDRGIIPPSNIQAGVLLQKSKGGRPRKQDEDLVTRQTLWRRKKELEKQGVLV